jgi:aryl-alcohol dehydrogenase-like predicted oxidoreductase
MATADRTTKLDDDLTVSAIGFGAGALISVYGDVDDAESLATLNRCLDLDVTFIDTANVYGGGDNERLIARLLADRRDEVTLATKFGIAGNPADGAAVTRPTCVSASTKALPGCKPTSLTCPTCTGVT